MRFNLDHIRQGPSLLEEQLRRAAFAGPIVAAVNMGPRELLHWALNGGLGRRDRSSPSYQLIIAYLYQQSALQTGDTKERERLLAQALDAYEGAINSYRRRDELLFYAWYSKGLIARHLGGNWDECREHLLMAHEIDTRRGEPVARIILHHISAKEWVQAYICTSFARDHWHGKPPAGARWGLEPDLYSWKILDYHCSVCLSIGQMEEALAAFRELHGILQHSPHLFTPEQHGRLLEKGLVFKKVAAHE